MKAEEIIRRAEKLVKTKGWSLEQALLEVLWDEACGPSTIICRILTHPDPLESSDVIGRPQDKINTEKLKNWIFDFDRSSIGKKSKAKKAS